MEDWMLDDMETERAVLVGLHASVFKEDEDASWETLDELEALLETAGGECVGKMLQTRNAPDAHTFIGEGKLQELVTLARDNDATLIVFDNELSPSQMRVLEEATGRTVLDRSALILDIFAQRARTGEGKLQVELAQYQYILPRLSGMGKSMSRLGGGIGTRGPGETKLETDRRHIRQRIDKLRRDLKDVRRVRAVQRRQRQKAELPLVAIVGYTNAGKSTLMNMQALRQTTDCLIRLTRPRASCAFPRHRKCCCRIPLVLSASCRIIWCLHLRQRWKNWNMRICCCTLWMCRARIGASRRQR